MNKVWNDQKIFEITFKYPKKNISPGKDLQVTINKDFKENVKIHFEENGDVIFSPNPVLIDSESKVLSVRCKIPGLFDLIVSGIEGPVDKYKLSIGEIFEIYQLGEKLVLLKIICRW